MRRNEALDNYKLTLVIPHTADEAERQIWYRRACRGLSVLCGGFTAYEAVGGWVDEAGKLVTEPVTVVWATRSDVFPPLDFPILKAALTDLCRMLKRELHQSCVYATIEHIGAVLLV